MQERLDWKKRIAVLGFASIAAFSADSAWASHFPPQPEHELSQSESMKVYRNRIVVGEAYFGSKHRRNFDRNDNTGEITVMRVSGRVEANEEVDIYKVRSNRMSSSVRRHAEYLLGHGCGGGGCEKVRLTEWKIIDGRNRIVFRRTFS